MIRILSHVAAGHEEHAPRLMTNSVAHACGSPSTHRSPTERERTITPDFGIDLGGRLGESRFPF